MREPIVASAPSDHPYVRHLEPPGPARPGWHRLPDPDPDHPDRPDLVADGRWWPPVVLRPEWLRRSEHDLLHVHFGFDDATPERLLEACEVLRRRARPLVLTVHDLRNPHHADPALLAAQLAVLVPRAAVVVTLTEGAAAEVRRRWGVEVDVLPHPHVVDLAVMRVVREARALGPAPSSRRVGVAAKSLRRNVDVGRLLDALVGAVRAAPTPTRLEVTVHRDVVERPGDARTADQVAALRARRDRGDLDLVVHEPWDDAELWRRLAEVDVAVLPYRFGTHSGWLEMCHDLGTSVVAPTTGCYADQGADEVYAADEHRVDGASLVDAVTRALAGRELGLPGLDADRRAAQRRAVAAAHVDLYARALATVRAERAS